MGSLVGLAIIAKDEETSLPRLLGSIEGAFDRVVLLDTGSTDKTVEVFSDWARTQEGLDFAVGRYKWKDDFSDARNAADGLLLFGDPAKYMVGDKPLVDWKCWADCDDILVGASNIRQLCENAPQELVAYFCGYNYATDPASGQSMCYLWRERIVRSTYNHPWQGRVHEAVPIDAPVQQVPSNIVEWIHSKDFSVSENSNDRNLRILTKWNEDDPGNSRVVGYLGTENAMQGKWHEAIEFYKEYATLGSKWDEERAQMYRKMASCYIELGDFDAARQAAYNAMGVLPRWPDSYLSLAEVTMHLGQWEQAKQWAQRVLEIGKPETMLIINPVDYSFLPLKVIAGCSAQLGDIEGALEAGEAAQRIVPTDQGLNREMYHWRNTVKRERTAKTFAMCAQQLIGHDEQFKALKLLEDCVPAYAMEHPVVCELRSSLRERLLWTHDKQDFSEHYETGGSKPEDFIPDERIDELCGYLPRTNFLLDGIKESLRGV